MSQQDAHNERVRRWLIGCMPDRAVQLTAARNLRGAAEREVWNCRLTSGARELDAILLIFKPGSLETVNTSLLPEQAAEKCFLAMSELPALGIPTPAVLGHSTVGGEAAVLYEMVVRTDWARGTTVAGARILARLHNLQEIRLSQRLRELVRLSDPREYRTTSGHAPTSMCRTIVHGDYFSKNIIPCAGGLCIIDWETLGWGSPMWDLGFLIGADPGLSDEEVEAVIAEYGSSAAVNQGELDWHRKRWSDFWRERARRFSIRTRAGFARLNPEKVSDESCQRSDGGQ